MRAIACSQITGFTDSTQTVCPPFWQTVFVGGNKVTHSPVRMRFLPPRIQMVDEYSTCAPPKDTEERMVFHMSCDTTQHRALETTHCVGWLMNCKQTSRGRESSHEGSHKLRCTSQRQPSHLLFLSTRLDLRRLPVSRSPIIALIPVPNGRTRQRIPRIKTNAELNALASSQIRHNHPSTRNARSVCAVAASMSSSSLVAAAFGNSSVAKSQCGRVWRHGFICPMKRAASCNLANSARGPLVSSITRVSASLKS
jgi:hypothetical protein